MTPASKTKKTAARKKATRSSSASSRAGGKKIAAKKGAKATKAKSAAKGGKAKATKAKAAKAPAPKKLPRAGSKARLAAVLERCDKAFGLIDPPETESVLEKAVYLILREGGSTSATEKAMASLREDFVDWNEVRVSRPSELARLMSGSSKASTLRRWDTRCRRIKEMIDQVYNDRNEPDFEFLLDQRPKGQIEYLEDLDDLGLHNAYALVQWLSGDDKLSLVSSELAQAAQSLQLTDSGAMAKAKKALSSLADKEQLMSVQAHLNQLGEMETDEWPAALKEFLA